VEAPVLIEEPAWATGITVDLSTWGVLLSCDFYFRVGDVVRLAFPAGENATSMRVTGHVVRVLSQSEDSRWNHTFAVEFDAPFDEYFVTEH